MLQFVLSVLVAGVLLANARRGTEITGALANRLLGPKGPEFEHLVGSTIGNVTTGILGVALIQTTVAALGFLVVGLAGAGLWVISFFFAAVLQVGVLVLVPAAIYVFATASTTKAVIFLVWCLIVGLMDNVLKPILLGQGAAVPHRRGVSRRHRRLRTAVGTVSFMLMKSRLRPSTQASWR